jgi:hypothetical protein
MVAHHSFVNVASQFFTKHLEEPLKCLKRHHGTRIQHNYVFEQNTRVTLKRQWIQTWPTPSLYLRDEMA